MANDHDRDYGLVGLTDRSRCPYRQANRLPFRIEALVVQLKKKYPSWGAPKIREKVRRRHGDITLPAISTVHAVLGRHERMHLTLKKEAPRPPGKNFLQQQAKFDQFIDEYNQERPHQALNMKYPVECYHPSPRPYTGLPELDYPFHDRAITVTQCGRLCFGTQKINLSAAFAGQCVGVKEVADHVWLISFMHYVLGFFDHESGRVECAPNPLQY